MNIKYLVLRVIRHFLPETLTRALLRGGVFIQPGLETREPAMIAYKYQELLEAKGNTLSGKRVLVFGYGGHFSLGVELLKRGAAHVTLTDLFAPPDDKRNDILLEDYEKFLQCTQGKVQPKAEWMSLLHGDIRKTCYEVGENHFDLIVSASVYEHLDDVDGITKALHYTLRPSGFFIALVDLRDHYFKLPFEMLAYSADTWHKWLNPTSNLNRLRLNDYKKVIGNHFDEMEILVHKQELAQFLLAKKRIRPEFLSGDDQNDAIDMIWITAVKTVHENNQ